MSAAEPGRMLGPYRLQTRLGAGAMGEVWRAIDTRLDRHVAVKLLPTRFAQDPDRRARMLREAKAAAGVPHANVVALFDIDEDEGQDYLVMELVEGRTIGELLSRGPLPLRQALDIAAGVAEALAAAHQKGILHRDIKAANVMVTASGGVKVLDFGLAKLRAGDEAQPVVAPTADTEVALGETMAASGSANSTETQAGTLLGTPAYFSPEQVAGQFPDERSEIFAVGVLLYEMIAGKNPFSGRNMRELFAQITRCAPAPLEAPERVRQVVARALAPEPAERFPDMGAFAQALREAIQALFGARPRRGWIAAAALAAALIAGTVGFLAARPARRSAADTYIEQALGEYDVYANDKANGSLHSAMRVAPDDVRPYAYKVLFQHAPADERRAAAQTAVAKLGADARARDRALVLAAAALIAQGPDAARAELARAGGDIELAFWHAELAWQAGAFDEAAAGYQRILAQEPTRFRGRIYDHYSACLLFRDRVADAVVVGERYAREFPGEADAIGTQATVYAAAGRLDDALRLAEDARRLNETEDSIAGLAKVRALRGELAQAITLYRRSVELVAPPRRPLRRAALAWVLAQAGQEAEAKATVAPCLPDGPEGGERSATVCWLVAGLLDPALGRTLAPKLRERTRVAPPEVPYGRPEALARIVEARADFAAKQRAPEDIEATLRDASDLYAAYHLPFFASYLPRLRAELRLARGDSAGAIAALQGILSVRPAEVPALVQLAQVFAAAGRNDEAEATRQKARAVWAKADPGLLE